MKYLVLLFLLNFHCFYGQKLIVLDEETNELLVGAEYVLYKNGKNIETLFSTENAPILINAEIKFDSIVFSKVGYDKKTILKLDAENVIFLNKTEKIIEEVLITNSKKDTLLGEKNKFNKRRSLPLINYTSHLLKVNNPFHKAVNINSLKFYVDKIYYKTNYVVKFYDLKLTDNILDYSDKIEEIFTSKPLTLTIENKNKPIIVDLTEYNLKLEANQNIFVIVELINYLDENDTVFTPELDKRTFYKTIYSKKVNYFSKAFVTQENRFTDFYNRNARALFEEIRSKIRFQKSEFLAPAFYLEIEKPN